MQWDLSQLYRGFQDDAFLKDFGKYEDMTEAFLKWGKQVPEQVDLQKVDIKKVDINLVTTYIEQVNALKLLASRLYQFASLSAATDANHLDAKTYQEKIGKLTKAQTEPQVRFQRWLCALKDDAFETLKLSSPLISEHAYYLAHLRLEGKHMLGLEAEVVLARLKSNGSEAWSQLQAQLTANLMVPIHIENQPDFLPLQAVRNLAFSSDAHTRKMGFEFELAAYPSIAPVSAAALNAIKGEVLVESEMRGFSSPLDKTLSDAHLNKQTLDVMLESVQNFLPILQAYQKKKAQLLGRQQGLPFFDIHAPLHVSSEVYTFERAKEMVLNAFSTFSPDLATFALDAFEGNWIDVAPKKGKRSGAFCSGIHGIKESRVLLNFTGSLNNVITLAHELGHGYHGRQIFNQTPLNGSYSMPVAETASIFCETILKQQLIAQAEEHALLGILDASIQGYAQTIMDIYSRYLFETDVFDKRANAALSVEQLNEMMIKAQKRAYGDALDPDTHHPYMWVNKVHYYYPQRNFYNFPYTFGLLFAKGLYAEYKNEGESFVSKYRHMLEMTGQNSVEEIAQLLGIDIQKKAFWDSALDVIHSEIRLFMEHADKLLAQKS